MIDARIPIVPLNTVLFPGGLLPLRIFEPRYVDMVSQCIKSGTGFGVCLIREGGEVGAAVSTYDIGTFAVIRDWQLRHDGILGVTVQGKQRFHITRQQISDANLILADVSYIDIEPNVELPTEYTSLAEWIRRSGSRTEPSEQDSPKPFSDASWVGFRLADCLPLKLQRKQYFLQLDDPIQRLERLNDVMNQMDLHV
jgi:Lon protease-like protein